MIRIFKKYKTDETGVAAVEGALLFPLFVLLGFGVVDSSILMMQNHRMAAGLSAAGEYLSKSSNPESVEDRARQLAISGSFDPKAKTFIDGMSLTDVLINYRETPNPETDGMRDYRGGDIIRVVEVSAKTPFKGILFLSLLSGGSIEVNARYEARLIGDVT